jgi:polysaccharide deacetylase family protein (PEP-CTERM system associated)
MRDVLNAVTVDVEDWFHICDIETILPPSQWDRCESRVEKNVTRILEILSRNRIFGTFFVLGYVAQRLPGVVKMIAEEGHEIASHGFEHVQIYKMTPDEFERDLARSKRLIQEIIGDEVFGYRAPEWSIRKGRRNSLWALHILAANGFRYDSSIAPLRIVGIPDAPRKPYTIRTNHGKIEEFPPLVKNTWVGNVPMGGGWGLRVFPYGMIRRAIGELNGQGMPAVIFLHPSEFDPDPPKIQLPLVKRFVCRGKIKSTEERLERLLGDFPFGAIREIYGDSD